MYQLNPEQRRLIDRLTALADERIAPHAAEVDATASFPRESIAALGESGYLGLTIPPEFGGMGQGLRVAAAALDTIAQRCASTAMVYLMHICGVSCYVAAPGASTAELRAAAGGNHLSTLAWSERGSRSHFWAPVSQASERDGSVVLNAEKSYVTSAGRADGYVVSTRWSEASTPTESMLYLVAAGTPGLEVAGEWEALGMRGNASAPMRLTGVTVPQDRALSEPGKGFETMLGVVLPWFQTGAAAVSVGIAEAATQAVQAHLGASQFEHLNSSLADLPNLRARLAQMRIETDRARAHLVATLDAAEEGAPTAQLLVLESKAAAAETATMVTDIAMRAAGGAGMRSDLPLSRHFRDARAAGVMAPTTDVLHDFIGKALLGMDLF